MMETQLIFKPIVRNINTNDLYDWDGEKFTNLRTGVSGTVTDVAAQKTFLFNLAATEMINEYPLIAELINKLDLKYDVLRV